MAIVKRREVDATHWDAYGLVDDTAGSLDVMDNPGSTMYASIEGGSITVMVPAMGGGGEIQIKDTAGTILKSFPADVKANFEVPKIKTGPGVGIQVVAANAGSQQATARVNISTFATFR